MCCKVAYSSQTLPDLANEQSLMALHATNYLIALGQAAL